MTPIFVSPIRHIGRGAGRGTPPRRTMKRYGHEEHGRKLHTATSLAERAPRPLVPHLAREHQIHPDTGTRQAGHPALSV